MPSNDPLTNLAAIKISLIKKSEAYFSDSGQEWLQQALQAIKTSEQLSESLGLYSAMAKRKLGAIVLEEVDDIISNGSAIDIQRWTTADAGRLILLISTIERKPEQAESIVISYFKMGDEAEHVALIRGLILFAPGEYLTEIALDAGRTNSMEILAALTLDNPYPANFYTDSEFNQMVLKGLFLGLAIKRVYNLQQRANPDLARMCENYIIERENAGRTIPVDIWLGIDLFASETGKQKMLHYLTHNEVGHRYYCTLTLIKYLTQDPSVESILRKQLETEQETIIIKLLQDNLPA